MNIENNTIAYIDYVLTNSKGEVIDSTENLEPLPFIVGGEQILPALEQKLMNHTIGDSIEVTLSPSEGYGEWEAGRTQVVPREEFAHIPNIAEGMQLQLQMDEDQTMVVTIKTLTETEVTLDANHPLAGESLTFKVTVANVRNATPDELTEGIVADLKKTSKGGCGGGCSCKSGGCC